MIENSDRGVTLNKNLAWTMFVAFGSLISMLISLVWWGSAMVADLQSATQQLAETVKQTQDQQDRDTDTLSKQISSNDGRIRTLEQVSARTGAQFESLSQAVSDVKTEQRQTNELLRQLLQGARQ